MSSTHSPTELEMQSMLSRTNCLRYYPALTFVSKVTAILASSCVCVCVCRVLQRFTLGNDNCRYYGAPFPVLNIVKVTALDKSDPENSRK